STRQSKRKATQEAAEKTKTAAKVQARKRAKKASLSFLPSSDEAENAPNRLGNLPREIFDEITSLLEPDALTCLSLTCKPILNVVGRKPWTECHTKRQVYYDRTSNFRRRLIPLLHRDAPHMIFCAWCNTLHPPLKPPREHRKTKLTKHCFGQWSTIDYLKGYSLLWEHIEEARENLVLESTDEIGFPMELLSGNYTVQHERLNYTLTSSGRQIGENLILKHQHIFRGIKAQSPLQMKNIMALPVRLCPHQTTSTDKPEPNRYTNGRLPSGLLTHSISREIPSSLRAGLPSPHLFRDATSSEKRQMDSAVPGTKALWTCRGCPTKWHVQYTGAGGRELKITAWHSFGDTEYHARQYWKMLVRREVANLGDEKRNSEFFSTTKQYLDF
ncbi:uncharacterized protein LY89DRAFT_558811, partial [Mollisia scopiformis]